MLVEKYDEFILSFVGSFTGLSDPYCEVSLGGQEHKTKVITNSLNPKWNSSVRAQQLQYCMHVMVTMLKILTVFFRCNSRYEILNKMSYVYQCLIKTCTRPTVR